MGVCSEDSLVNHSTCSSWYSLWLLPLLLPWRIPPRLLLPRLSSRLLSLLLLALLPSRNLHQSMSSQLLNLLQSLLLLQLPLLLCLTGSQPSVSTVCPTTGSPLWLPLLPSKPSSCSYILQALPQLNTAWCS